MFEKSKSSNDCEINEDISRISQRRNQYEDQTEEMVIINAFYKKPFQLLT